MTKVTRMPNPQDQALATIRRLARDTANVMMSGHATERLVDRKYTMAQVYKCLRQGTAIEGPVLDHVNQPGWSCKLEIMAAGAWIKVVCKLVQEDDEFILVITVI